VNRVIGVGLITVFGLGQQAARNTTEKTKSTDNFSFMVSPPEVYCDLNLSITDKLLIAQSAPK
jgi:hypothetical protein